MKTEDLIKFNNRRVVYNSVWNKIDHSGVVDNGVLYTWYRDRHVSKVEVFLGNVKSGSVKLHDTDHEKYFADRIKEEFFNWMLNQEHELFLKKGYSDIRNLGELIETYIDEYHHFELKDGILYVPSKESLLLQENQDISLGVHHDDFYEFVESLKNIFNQNQIDWEWYDFIHFDGTEIDYKFRYDFKEYLKVYYNIEYGYSKDELPF